MRPSADAKRILVASTLALVLLFAASARMTRAREGLPYLHHWDEPQVAGNALHMMKTGDFNPHFFHYGSVTIYLSLLTDVLHFYYLAERDPDFDPLVEIGRLQTEHETYFHWRISHPSFYLWNRWIVALLGTASAGLCYLLGTAAAGRGAGLLAAAFLAGLEIHVVHSASITVDVPFSFLILLAAWLSLRFLESGRPGPFAGALAACGLAASTKYNAVISLVMPLLALGAATLTGRPAARRWLWWLVFVVPPAAFLAGTPYALLDLPAFLSQSAFEAHHYSFGRGISYIEPGWPHLRVALGTMLAEMGVVPAVLALVGFARFAASRIGLVLAAFPVLFLAFMTSMKVPFHRNLIVVYAFASVAFAAGAATVVAAVARAARLGPAATWRLRAAAGVLLGALVVWQGAGTLAEASRAAREPETRTAAIDRVNARAAAGSGAGRVGVAAELRVHEQDLRRLVPAYVVRPALELLCVRRPDLGLILVGTRHETYEKELKRVVARINAAQPQDVAVVETVGVGRSVFLDVHSVNPEVRIVDAEKLPRMPTATCPLRFGLDELLMSRDFPIRTDGLLQMYWSGTVSTPSFEVGPGSWAFRWRARGTAAGGRFPTLSALAIGGATALDSRTLASADVVPGSGMATFELAFEVDREMDVLLRLDFFDDAYEPGAREDRNLFLAEIELLPAGPPPPGDRSTP